jgi:starch synthase (maltosyl-transferring)
LNQLRRQHSALQQLSNLSFHDAGNPNVLFYIKAAWQNDLLCAVTVDPLENQEAELVVPLERLGLGPSEPYQVEDLLTGRRERWCGPRQTVHFSPEREVARLWRIVRSEGAVSG